MCEEGRIGYKLFGKFEYLRRSKLLKSYKLYSSLSSYNEESVKFLEKYGVDIVNESCSWLSLHYNHSDYLCLRDFGKTFVEN